MIAIAIVYERCFGHATDFPQPTSVVFNRIRRSPALTNYQLAVIGQDKALHQRLLFRSECFIDYVQCVEGYLKISKSMLFEADL